MLRLPTYSVSRSGKEPLLGFLLDALRASGCEILSASPPDRAPFVITFEAPSGERLGVICYAFLANSRVTRNRPDDEHRFQVKYGSDPKRLLRMEIDPTGLFTTLFVGIDLERGFLVGADPVLNNPSPMFKSVEFKRHHARAIIERGWFQWQRDQRTEHRDQVPAEVLVGVTAARLLDFIRFERTACGLDQGHRQLLAEKFAAPAEALDPSLTNPARHRLIAELGLDQPALLDLIADTKRLKMAVRGWVAEVHLEQFLVGVPGVSECHRINEEGKPDIALRWRGSKPLLIECKNVLRERSADGSPRLDFQRTRASKKDPCSRYYKRTEFAVVAACLHAVTEAWEFRFALTSGLPPHLKCEGRIRSAITVGDWSSDAGKVFDAVGQSG